MKREVYLLKLMYFENGILEDSFYSVFGTESLALKEFDKIVLYERDNSWIKEYPGTVIFDCNFIDHFEAKLADNRFRTEIDVIPIDYISEDLATLKITKKELCDIVTNQLSDVFYVTTSEINDTCRKVDAIKARHAQAHILFSQDMGLSEIGRITKREHTSITNSLKRFDDLYVTDKSFKNLFYSVIEGIKHELANMNYEFNYKYKSYE